MLDRIPVPAAARRAWARWKIPLLWTGVVYLVVAAAGRLIYALPYLIADRAEWSALDLGYRYEEVQRWFGGLPVYGELDRLLYPPASYTVLWPFLGWLPFESARVLWAVSTLGAAAVIALVMHAATGEHPLRERLLIALLAFAAFPVQISILVGQLPVHAVAFLAAGAFFLTRRRPALWSDAVGGALVAASIVKPTLTVPLAAALLIGANRWRPALLAGVAYGLLAFIGAAAQADGIVSLHLAWLESTGTPSLIAEGVPNLHLWLAQLGQESWAAPASALVLLVFCAWCWRARRADAWVLIGAAAVVARLWAYHREYDDVILVLTTIGLLRLAGSGDPAGRVLPGVLLAAAWATLLTPTWAIYDLPAGAVLAIEWAHTVVWLAVLAFFVHAGITRSTALDVDADTASRPTPVSAG
jgi:hypothetical protein